MSGPAGATSPKHKLCPTCRRIYPAASNFCPQDQTALVISDDVIAGRYILSQMVGAGAMGKVYRAEDTQLGRQVALKLLNPAKDAHLRIDREAKAVGALDHDNVVRVYERGQHDDGRMFIAMEYLEGESLRQYLATHGKLPMKQALELWLQAVRGVAAAHKKSVVHRDLKPDNLFLARREQDDGTIEQLKVLDFGIAQLHTDRPAQTRGTMRIGTPGYVAPEQWMHGEATARSDVYSLGVILLEMLTGRRSVAANPLAQVEALERYILQQRLSPELGKLAGDVLAPDPAQRPENARVLLDRLRALPESQIWSGGAAAPRESLAAVSPGSSDEVRRRVERRSEELLPLSDDEEGEVTERVGIESLRLPEPAPRPLDVSARLQAAMNQPTLRVDLPGLVFTPVPERPPASRPEKTQVQAVNRPSDQAIEPIFPEPSAPVPTPVVDPVTAQVIDEDDAIEVSPTGQHSLSESEPLPQSGQNTLVLSKPGDLRTLNLPSMLPLEALETRISSADSAKQSPLHRPAKEAATVMSHRSHAATVTSGVAPTMPLGRSSADFRPLPPPLTERLLTFLRAPTALGPVGGVLILCALLGILASVAFIWFWRSPR